MSFSEQELEEFKSEALELLDVAEKSLLCIDTGSEFRPCFDAIFRSFHNLKGASGMMELIALQTHMHELENILMPFKEQTSMPKNYTSFFLRGVDGARSILDGKSISFDFNVPSAEKAAEVPAIKAPEQIITTALSPEMQQGLGEFISECDEIIERVSKQLQSVELGTHTKDTVDDLYRDIHSLKGAAYLFGFSAMGDIAHAMESSLEPIRNGTHKPNEALLNGLFQALKCVEQEVECLKQNKKNETIESQVPALAGALTATLKTLQPIAATSSPIEMEKTVENKISQDTSAAPKAEEISGKDADSGGSIRVSVALLDKLMTLMGEMVLVRNQVLQFSSESEDLDFLNLSQRLNVVTSEIQGEMMKTRMQPIGNILNKFNRVVRDLSQELKKNISLHLSGSETELDKTLLEAIKDPLTHIVRNSCDHGIETPEIRKKSGKPEGGTVNIRSYHEGGQVVIEVSDDGKGLHKEVLLKKGLEKGLITEAQAAQMGEKDIYNLIFAPGFSTAAAITNVSGRGVGMDVVRTNIEKIGGTVELESRPGNGTTIRLKIPLTLAIVPALIVHCGTGTFAIPQVKLIELVRVDQNSESKIEYLQGAPVFRLRGNILPLVDLNKILGLSPKKEGEENIVNIAVLNADQYSFGVIVDKIEDTADIVVKPLSRLLKSLLVYSGATILGDGSVALILDVPGIAKSAQLSHEASQADKAKSRIDESASANRMAEQQEFILTRVNSPTKHAIVLGYVHRLEEIHRDKIELSGSQRVVRYRDTILPLISVNEQLNYGPSKKEGDVLSVIVVERGGHLFGIEVDEIVDTLSTAAELDSALVKTRGVIGNLNTEEELIVVIDPFEIISLAYPNFNNESEKTFIQAAEQTTQRPQQTAPLKILLVEDTIFFRKMVRHVLEKAGHQVITANDGVEALEILNKGDTHFDVIVSDIEMPRMNGFKLASTLRSQANFSQIPLLALSSRYDQAYIQEGTKSGFNLYLEKLKPGILLKALDDLTFEKRRSA